MIVKVRSKGVSPRRVKRLEAARDFFLQHMIEPRERAKVKVFRFLLDIPSTSGDLGYETDLVALPGHYTIGLSMDGSVKEAVNTLAHEFIHLNQSLTGRLQVVHTGRSRGQAEWLWEGQSFGLDPYRLHRTREAHILHLPWEAEAYENQTQWALRFFT